MSTRQPRISRYFSEKLNAMKFPLSFASSMAREKHIAVFAFPFTTHAIPLLNLVRYLAFVSPDVKFTFFNSASSNSVLFADGISGNIMPWNVADGLPEGYSFQGDPHEPVKFFISKLPDNFKAATVEVGTKFSCLITDAFYWFAADMAEEMGVPWIAFWTAGPRALFVHLDVTNIREKMGFEGPPEKTLDFIPDFLTIRTMDLPPGIITSGGAGPVSSMLDKLETKLQHATAVVTNAVAGLDIVVHKALESKLRKILSVGPLALTAGNHVDVDEHKCLEFLECHKPGSVVYISFGSTVTPPESEVSALAKALEQTTFPFLWSYRGFNHEKFLKPFVDRSKGTGKFVPWAPQTKVLQHPSVGVFVTHGGWNSALESIIGGVPMICRPFFGDQTLNLRTVEAVWGIGIGIEGRSFTKEGMLTALQTILSSDEGKKIRKNIQARKEVALDSVRVEGRSVKDLEALVEIIQR